MKVSAQHKNARISAQKARLIADLIRGKDVASALTICQFSLKKQANLPTNFLSQQISMPGHNVVPAFKNLK